MYIELVSDVILRPSHIRPTTPVVISGYERAEEVKFAQARGFVDVKFKGIWYSSLCEECPDFHQRETSIRTVLIEVQEEHFRVWFSTKDVY
jgi:hypothetical protein